MKRTVAAPWVCSLVSSFFLAVFPAEAAETNDLNLTILPSWPIQLELSWPSNFTHAVDVYACLDLRTAQWQFLVAGEATTGLEALVITDLDSTNHTAGFYIQGDAEQDSDLDVLADDRERYIYKTNPDRADTDGDGLEDGWEVAYDFDPLAASVADALGDPDGDGFGNLEEQYNGTFPDTPDANSPTGSVATVRFYYNEDDRMTAVFAGTGTAEQMRLSVADNIEEEVSVFQ
jgi:hypothetical protein